MSDVFPVEVNIEADEDGFYHIGDMILTEAQYQEAYGESSVTDDFVQDSGLRDENSRWKDGSK